MSGKYENYYPDTLSSVVSVETLVANTSKQITIPSTVNSVVIQNPSASPIFCKLDAAWSAVPSGGNYVTGFMIPPNETVLRKFSERAIGSGHTLNLICAAAATPAVEFLQTP